jgi:competence protein ComEC
MASYLIMFFLGGSYFAGIFLAYFYNIHLFWLFWVLTFLVFICCFLWAKNIFTFSFALLACLVGFLRFGDFASEKPLLLEAKGSFYACIIQEVDYGREGDRLTVLIEKAWLDNVSDVVELNSKAVVFLEHNFLQNYGDCLLLKGKIQNSEFDFFHKDEIYYFLFNAQVVEHVGALGFSFRRFLFSKIFKFKRLFEAQVEKIFLEPDAGLVSGLLLGKKRGLTKNALDKFSAVGLTHIVAVSGYNITILVLVIGNLFKFLSRKKLVVISVMFVVLFVVLTGMSASVIRAGIMGIIGLLAIWFGRDYNLAIALFLSALLMNLWNPKTLIYDVGFQLSFLATVGVVYLGPFLEKKLFFLPQTFSFRENLSLTLASQITTLPVILYNFGFVSLIAPIANILILPLIPLVMILGFFAVCISIVSFKASLFVAFFVHLIILLIFYVIDFLA